MSKTDIYEDLAQEIDKIENLVCAMNLPMGAEFHFEQMKNQFPDIIDTLKRLYVELTDNNPWE